MASSTKLAPIRFVPERIDASQKPSRSRLKRRGIDADRKVHPALAKIEILEQGGYRRPIITRGGCHPRGRFRSFKSGLTQVFEGKIEPWLAMRNEIDAKVIDYQCHPFRIYLTVNGKRCTYRPDAVRLFFDGRIELLEAKRTPKDIDDPDYEEMLTHVREIARQCGWQLRVLYRKDVIPNAHSIENIEMLFGRLFGELSAREEQICRAVRAEGNTIRWDDLRDSLGNPDPRHSDAVIETAAAQGMFSFDLDVERTDDILLQPVAVRAGKSAIRF